MDIFSQKLKHSSLMISQCLTFEFWDFRKYLRIMTCNRLSGLRRKYFLSRKETIQQKNLLIISIRRTLCHFSSTLYHSYNFEEIWNMKCCEKSSRNRNDEYLTYHTAINFTIC